MNKMLSGKPIFLTFPYSYVFIIVLEDAEGMIREAKRCFLDNSI
jgi:hypothetical protein